MSQMMLELPSLNRDITKATLSKEKQKNNFLYLSLSIIFLILSFFSFITSSFIYIQLSTKIESFCIQLNQEKGLENDKYIQMLNQRNINSETKIQELNDRYNLEVKSLKEEINSLKKIIEEHIEEDEDDFENEEDEYSYKNKKLRKKQLKKSFNEMNSKILSNVKELAFIQKRLQIRNDPSFTRAKKIKKYNLLYRASRDGDKSIDFHFYCDNKQNTLSIIKTNKGYIFGGFTEVTWNHEGWKKDKEAFCFSLDLKKIYNNLSGNNAIWAYNIYGPYFGDVVFGVFDKAFEKGGWTNSHVAYDYIIENEINGGEIYFQIEEIEVFEVLFEYN